MQTERPYVLNVSGLDPSAGAGLLADIKTCETLKVYAFGIASALTMQDGEKVFAVKWISLENITKQAKVLFDKYEISVCKIGIMPNTLILLQLISFLKAQNPKIKIIVDPVLKSSSGFGFYEDYSADDWSHILKEITLLTPNYEEMSVFAKEQGIEDLAKHWSSFGNILLKGGHHEQHLGTDVLYQKNKVFNIPPTVTEVYQKHGSGCVLSAAIASYIALGSNLEEACIQAKTYIDFFLNSNPSILGFHQTT